MITLGQMLMSTHILDCLPESVPPSVVLSTASYAAGQCFITIDM